MTDHIKVARPHASFTPGLYLMLSDTYQRLQSQIRRKTVQAITPLTSVCCRTTPAVPQIHNVDIMVLLYPNCWTCTKSLKQIEVMEFGRPMNSVGKQIQLT